MRSAKKFLTATLLIFLFSANAGASVINVGNTTTTAGGKTPNLQGLDWLTLDVTEGQNRNSVEGGFGGLIASGWRYASRFETATLLGSLWGGTQPFGDSLDNYDGASWFINNFLPTAISTDSTSGGVSFTSYRGASFYFGNDGDCDQDSSLTCIGQVGEFQNADQTFHGIMEGACVFVSLFINDPNCIDPTNPTNFTPTLAPVYFANTGPAGFFHEHLGLDVNQSNNNILRPKTDQTILSSSLLVRSTQITQVNEPYTLALLGIGLIGIYGVSRRRHTSWAVLYCTKC